MNIKLHQACLLVWHVILVVVPVTQLLNNQLFCCMVLNSAATCFISMLCHKIYQLYKL